MTYRTYKVMERDRGPLLDFMLDALRSAGCTIVQHSPRNLAPFRIAFETPAGERLGILVYAFYANSKLTKNRPDDEWRFQVKYGSDARAEHELWIDPYGLYTTLFVGISPEHGLFVGADPMMHNPTRFFISVEFKDEHVSEIQEKGWHGWERESRREDSDTPVEVLVGGTTKRFLQYVRFERAAAGLDQGHRQLLAERWLDAPPMKAKGQLAAGAVPAQLHALAREFEMPETEVLDLIASARRLKMAVRGWVAEEHLVKRLSVVAGVSECVRLDIEGGADVSLRFEGSRALTVQCKNVLRNRAADGTARMDFQKTRASQGDPCSRYYKPEEYDLIAACLHAVTERWEYKYVVPGVLDRHKKCPARVGNNVRIDTRWTPDAGAILGQIARQAPVRPTR